MTQTQLPTTTLLSPNFLEGRSGQPVSAIVVHRGEGSLDSIRSWFMTPTSQVSSHYVISLTGDITLMVLEEDTAWHAGIVDSPTWVGIRHGINPNDYTIGIELEGYAINDVPFSQYLSLARLIEDICTRYNIVPSDETIALHREIRASKTCPGLTVKKEDILTFVGVIRNGEISPTVTPSLSNDNSTSFECC